ncbi:TetR/AcrR family transcriptional regulator [Maribellus sp. YY47]|uniref:TetR/AcrR family transcriptional regulator n=1 Tax=Maribellus sp. YY47 TaxID=2929486 RepID=UPI002000B5F1|nr:TetR/AcrR family transcriptional regulator [Maribellus sp. YY47]MCK3684894.1 TetR/AcrR family transcriptional regulator [Maribellus sp. YY47]
MAKSKLQIIEAAAHTFDRYGFKKTTMDDIAYAAGKGKSSLYYYFKNKEEVFEAVVDYEAEHLKNEIYEVLNKTECAVEKLRGYILIRMQRFVKRGNLYKALTDNFLTTFSFIEKIRDRHREWELEMLEQILSKGIERKEFKPVDIEFMSNAVLTAMIGFELPLLQKAETETEFDKKINDVIDMLFYGICS